jgi:hypothetical protein
VASVEEVQNTALIAIAMVTIDLTVDSKVTVNMGNM